MCVYVRIYEERSCINKHADLVEINKLQMKRFSFFPFSVHTSALYKVSEIYMLN